MGGYEVNCRMNQSAVQKDPSGSKGLGGQGWRGSREQGRSYCSILRRDERAGALLSRRSEPRGIGEVHTGLAASHHPLLGLACRSQS